MSDLLDNLVRPLRNALLNETDKYVSIPDYPLTTEQKLILIQYRQSLRDLPSLINVNNYNSDNIYSCFPSPPSFINLSAFYSN
jgi:hypothetical protein